MVITGWLDRNGKHYPAPYMEHYNVAMDNFGKSDWELEEMGIVKIYIGHINCCTQAGTNNTYYIQSPHRLSKAQFDWLAEHGFDICEEDKPL